MMLDEIQSRLKKTTVNSTDELDILSMAYILLDFDKDDFCKLIDAIGVEKWLSKERRFKSLTTAFEERAAKESYIANKDALDAARREVERATTAIEQYEKRMRVYC